MLVSNDAYLLQLVRYIHKNPVKSGIVKEMKDYTWSSYNGYLSYANKWNWLYKDFVFSLLTNKKRGRLNNFITFMRDDDSEEVARLFFKKNLPSMFGPDSFTTRIKETYYFKKMSYEVPASRRLAPGADKIIREVCDYYAIDQQKLFTTRRGVFNKPRAVAVYLIRHLRGDELNSIKSVFRINTYSTVSSILQKMASLMKTDRKLRGEIRELKRHLTNSQM